jgi:hypothetical protein
VWGQERARDLEHLGLILLAGIGFVVNDMAA